MVSALDMHVVSIRMPERGTFWVRAGSEPVFGKWVVMMDYGEDVGIVNSYDIYDPLRHGDRMPGFTLLRPFDPEQDGRLEADNVKLAASMTTTFIKVAKLSTPDIRVPYARLSLTRKRLFLRFTAPDPRVDVTRAVTELETIFGVNVQCRQLGPRDEVSMIGGLGVCGRACCCASWQQQFPQRLTPNRREMLPSLMNGTCGRFKCCLAFEREEMTITEKGTIQHDS